MSVEEDDYAECPCGNKSVGYRFVAVTKGLDPNECPSCHTKTLVYLPMPDEIRMDINKRYAEAQADQAEANKKGWSTTTARVPWKRWREDVEDVLLRAEWGAPTPNTAGTKINREARIEGWHLGIEESTSSADGKTIFRGAAENEDKGVFVRMPPAVVDKIRQKICPEAPGRSE